MSEFSTDCWKEFGVDHEVTPIWPRLTVVSHVAHGSTALEILMAGKVKAQLIFDESRLNTQRILVVWLSPNDWTNKGGFRYGNIAFEFDWSKLIHDKIAYWVGAMDYSPNACRILITGNMSGKEFLVKYQPGQRDGPWWIGGNKSDKEYWNGKFCLEFMIEEDLPIKDVKETRFVDHHPHQCCINPQTCSDKGQKRTTAAARFLAGASSRNLLSGTRHLWKSDKRKFSFSFEQAWSALSDHIFRGDVTYRGSVSTTATESLALATAALESFCKSQDPYWKLLFGLFDSSQTAIQSVSAIIERQLEIEKGSLPDWSEIASDF